MEKYKKFVACVPQAGTRATTANPTLRLPPYVGLILYLLHLFDIHIDTRFLTYAGDKLGSKSTVKNGLAVP